VFTSLAFTLAENWSLFGLLFFISSFFQFPLFGGVTGAAAIGLVFTHQDPPQLPSSR